MSGFRLKSITLVYVKHDLAKESVNTITELVQEVEHI